MLTAILGAMDTILHRIAQPLYHWWAPICHWHNALVLRRWLRMPDENDRESR